MLWVLDASINISMEPFRAFVADQLPDRQRPAGYAMQTFFIGVGAVVAGFMPYLLAKAGVSNVGTGTGASAIADTVRYSFFFGAAVLFVALLWTVLSTREYPPTELHAFADATPNPRSSSRDSAYRARRRGAVWLLLGIAAAFCVWHFALEKALYILAGGFAAWGLALLVIRRPAGHLAVARVGARHRQHASAHARARARAVLLLGGVVLHVDLRHSDGGAGVLRQHGPKERRPTTMANIWVERAGRRLQRLGGAGGHAHPVHGASLWSES